MGSRLEKNSHAVRRNIQNHAFDNEQGEEYEGSKFGGFPEYFRRKKIKLQNLDVQLRSEHGDKPQIFRGIVAHVNGYTQPSLNDLHVLIVTHGGGFIQYLDGKTQVTHIIASNLTPKKAEDFKRYRIVKPAWIVESVAAGKLLPWENYRVIDEGSRQKVLKFDESGVTGQVNRKRTDYKEQSDTSWYTKQLAEDAAQTQQPNEEYGLDDFDFSSADLLSNGSQQVEDASGVRRRTPQPNQPVGVRSSESVKVDGGEASRSSKIESELLVNDSVDPLESPKSSLSTAPSSPEVNIADDETNLQQEPDGIDKAMQVTNESVKHMLDIPAATSLKHTHGDEDPKKEIEEEPPRPLKKAKMTPEDHNRELLSDPRIRKSSVLNPGFLEQYYRESRLHHLSTWKADLKSQLQALTAEKTASQKAKQKRASGARRYVLHVDFDSFFVAVSLKNHPHLQDKPAVVAHGAGSGSEIASCNYAARKYGVKNGMWMKRAQEMCGDLKVLPYDFPGYEAASRLFYDAIMDTGGIVQSVSIDEALVDISVQCHAAGGTDGTGMREGSIWREQAKAEEIGQAIRERVKEESGCAVSVGIGGNILLAKVALRKAKPAGQYQIKPEDALDFIGNLEVQTLPGVAYSIGGKLEEIGIKFVKDIRECTKERLTSVLGPKTGDKIWNYSRGIDRAEVGDQVIRKSVSAEVNWGVRFETQEQVEEFMVSLSGELSRRLLKEGVKGKNLTMKVMRRARDAPMDPPKHLGHGKCDIYNKSIVLGILTNDRDTISKETISILRGFGFSPGELRGLGIQMTKLEPIKQTPASNADGSQKKLEFNAVRGPPKPMDQQKQSATLDYEHAVSPNSSSSNRAERAVEDTAEPSRPGSQFKLRKHEAVAAFEPTEEDDDIQDDPETPKRSKTGAIPVYSQLSTDSPSKKPLNTLGTQFILPTQVDPQVLAELPRDVRARLEKHAHQTRRQQTLELARDEHYVSQDNRPIAFTALPNESQIDPAILQALPEEIRREIMSQYQRSPTKGLGQGGQSILPQSPRKNRTVKTSGVRGRTRGRPRGGSLLARLKGAASRSNNPTLTQANFVAPNHADSESDANAAEIAPEFLEALPQDIRAEVVENHRREQLKRTGGLEVFRRRRHQSSRGGEEELNRSASRRIIRKTARPPRPTFTQQKLSKPDELRSAVSSWIEEFYDDGPYQEDVEALCKYLKSVVAEERNMRKAVDLVRWMAYKVDDTSVSEPCSETGTTWTDALDMIKAAVNDAVKSRGLGTVDFDL